jgi:hypothetical protein
VDPQGAAVPGVTVSARGPSLPGTRETVSDATGAFRLLALPPGVYTVRASLAGFKTIDRSDIEVNVDRTVTLTLALETAAVSETVEVRASTPVVDTTDATSGVAASADLFYQIPIRRDFYDIARVVPGVTYDPLGAAIGGSTSAENQYIIDGLNTTGVDTGTQGKTLNFDFVQEVEVKTGGLNAEYGRLTGGALNVITKSGSNTFQGDFFGFNEPQQDATYGSQLPTWATTTFNTSHRYDYGVDLGGYIVQDRLWFFGAFDRINKRDVVTVTSPIGGTAPPEGSTFNADTTWNNFAAKLTWRAGNDHTITGSVFGDPNSLAGPVIKTTNPIGYQILGEPSTFSGTLDEGGTDTTVHYDGVLGPTTLLHASFGQHRESEIYGGVGASTVAFSNRTVVPNQNSGGFFTGFDNQNFVRNVYKADLTRVWGSHEVKIGGDFEGLDATVDRYSGGGGQRIYEFSSDGVLYYRHRVFIDQNGLDKNNPATWNILYPLVSAPQTRNASFFARDSYKVLTNVTINYGLRWEDQKMIGAGGVTAFNIATNWAPRIGVVWDPTKQGKSRVYFNYGRYYENIPMDINIRSFGGEVTGFIYNFDPNPANLTPDPNAPRRSELLGGAKEPVDPSLKGQYIDEWIGGIDYEVAPRTVAGIKMSYRSLGRVIEDFLVPAQGNYFIANPGEGTLGQSLGFYDGTVGPSISASRKNTSVEVTLRRGLSNNWQLLGSYVWQKLEGNYDGTYQTSTGQLDPNINSAFDYGDFMINSYGRLTNDRSHQVKFNGTYTLPSGPLKNLNLGGSFHWFSGVPLTAYGYSFAYSNWEYYLTPRGSLGIGPAEWEGDVHLAYPIPAGGKKKANLMLDIFDVFNRQAPIVPDQRYNLDTDGPCAGIPAAACNGDGGLQHNGAAYTPIAQLANPIATATNPSFLKKYTMFTQPRSIRFGVRFSF